MNQICEHRQRARRDPRHRRRKSERESLRRDVAEQQHDHEHRRHRDDRSPFVAEPRQQNDRREAFGEHVGRLVQPDDHDQRLERPAHQAVERALHRRLICSRVCSMRASENSAVSDAASIALSTMQISTATGGWRSSVPFSRATATDPILRQSARYHQSPCRPLAPNDLADSPHRDTQATRQLRTRDGPGFAQKSSS